MAYEVITTTDKDARDRMFEDLRQNGNELEKRVVKFSSNEPVIGDDGKPIVRELSNYAGKNRLHNGEDVHNFRVRPLYRSTWSVAYPILGGTNV